MQPSSAPIQPHASPTPPLKSELRNSILPRQAPRLALTVILSPGRVRNAVSTRRASAGWALPPARKIPKIRDMTFCCLSQLRAGPARDEKCPPMRIANHLLGLAATTLVKNFLDSEA